MNAKNCRLLECFVLWVICSFKIAKFHWNTIAFRFPDITSRLVSPRCQEPPHNHGFRFNQLFGGLHDCGMEYLPFNIVHNGSNQAVFVAFELNSAC